MLAVRGYSGAVEGIPFVEFVKYRVEAVDCASFIRYDWH